MTIESTEGRVIIQERKIICFVMKNRLPASAAIHNMIKGMFVLYSSWSWQDVSLASFCLYKIGLPPNQDLTPLLSTPLLSGCIRKNAKRTSALGRYRVTANNLLTSNLIIQRTYCNPN